jgi:formylglycine-generating enzyme required for sulfatase activity
MWRGPGQQTPFWWGSPITPEQANYDGTLLYKGGGHKGAFRRKTVSVSEFSANPWGLYQIHGNVWEWVEDCWNANYGGAPGDGSAWTSGECKYRVRRGGSWFDQPQALRSAVRGTYFSDNREDKIGFRVARTLTP